MNLGIIGAGNISGIYLKNLTEVFNHEIKLVGIADLDSEKALKAAEEFKLPKRYQSVDELLGDDDIGLVINLTIPKAHYSVNKQILEAGKHVYCEKPFCEELSQARELLELADKKGLQAGGAPDTFLGGGLQYCRQLIDEGKIGRPVGATAFMACHGHESWHPDPEFYYQKGGGPMFDMGPYYLTALVSLLGPIQSLSGSAKISFNERTITSEKKNGKIIKVETPTHLAGTLDFESGATGTIITSFDVWHHSLPFIEIYGSEGSLSVPDPNTFGGPVSLKRHDDEEWHELEIPHPYTENSRGLGAVLLARSVEKGTPHFASGELTTHILEAMHGIHISSDKGIRYDMTSRISQPESFSLGSAR